MKTRWFLILLSVFAAAAVVAGQADFAGEYTDRNYLKGKAVFQMSLEQSGNEVSVFFSAVHTDGNGAAPEADGKGEIVGGGSVRFNWSDSFNNSGSGTIKKSGDDVIVSIKTTKVADSRCLQFYGDNIRLKSVGKK